MTMFGRRFYRYSAYWIGFLILYFSQSMNLHAQSISGIINKYAQVLDIDTCLNEVLIGDATGFGVGDRVLLIQMKGALIDESNTPSFGTIIDFGNAGNYEFGTIAKIKGLQITLQNKLVRTYNTKGAVQIVRVPQYVDGVVTSTVTGLPWDGARGGIVVLEASASVTLNADINVNGLGFRGGDSSENSAAPFDSDYYTSRTSGDGGIKGEGIVQVTLTFEAGRGPLANGGGGGNNQNGGGGGGGNGGNGGTGGDQTELRGRFPNGGIGGRPIPQPDKIFFGGGGGGAHENDSRGTSGARGGGIVIIRTPVIKGGGRIFANGFDAREAGADGAGGGGAGGTIVLDVDPVPNTITLSAVGGKGGNNNADTLPTYCYAPGGGGSGGRVVVKGASVPPSLLAGGTAGVVTAPNLACKGSTYGATDGEKGGGTWNNIIFDGNVTFSYPRVLSSLETICEGDSIQLNLPGAHGIKWSPGAGLDNDAIGNPKASPAVTTRYSVSFLDSRNCAFLDTVLVVVNPRPKPVIAGSANVCSGQDFFYTVNPLPGATYLWTATGGTIQSGQGTENIGVQWSNGTTGILQIDVTASGTTCSGTSILLITINPAISAQVIGADTICEGESDTLTATAGYVKYEWSNGDSLQSIKVTKAGDYYVKTTSAGGCVTYSDTVSVGVNPLPTVSINASTLILPDVGGIDTLTVSDTFASQIWSNGKTTDTIFVIDSGTYSVAIVDSNGCSANALIHIIRDLSTPEITLSLDTLEAAPCELVTFPIRIDTSKNMPPSGATDFITEITFDATILAPVDKSIQSSTNGRWRTLTIHGIRPDNQINGLLPGIEFEVALGDSVATRIIIETFIFTNGKKVVIRTYNGMLRLKNLCTEGGARLFSETDSLVLRQNIPNPAHTTTVIRYTLIEEGNYRLWITDVLGRRVMTVLNNDIVKPGDYSVQVNTASLGVGNYFYILQTPTSVKRRMMRIER